MVWSCQMTWNSAFMLFIKLLWMVHAQPRLHHVSRWLITPNGRHTTHWAGRSLTIVIFSCRNISNRPRESSVVGNEWFLPIDTWSACVEILSFIIVLSLIFWWSVPIPRMRRWKHMLTSLTRQCQTGRPLPSYNLLIAEIDLPSVEFGFRLSS